MATRSLNKAQLIGNLTRDPELRYTPQGTAVCTFGLATNRAWTTEGGEKREETEFHRIVAWNKLAELCSQLLFKGRRVFVEGRLQTRTWVAQDGAQRQTTEVVIEDMIILDSRRAPGVEGAAGPPVAPPEKAPEEVLGEEPVLPQEVAEEETGKSASDQPVSDQAASDTSKKTKKKKTDEVKPDDIPF